MSVKKVTPVRNLRIFLEDVKGRGNEEVIFQIRIEDANSVVPAVK